MFLSSVYMISIYFLILVSQQPGEHSQDSISPELEHCPHLQSVGKSRQPLDHDLDLLGSEFRCVACGCGCPRKAPTVSECTGFVCQCVYPLNRLRELLSSCSHGTFIAPQRLYNDSLTEARPWPPLLSTHCFLTSYILALSKSIGFITGLASVLIWPLLHFSQGYKLPSLPHLDTRLPLSKRTWVCSALHPPQLLGTLKPLSCLLITSYGSNGTAHSSCPVSKLQW
jgi:hypothetical protein